MDMDATPPPRAIQLLWGQFASYALKCPTYKAENDYNRFDQLLQTRLPLLVEGWPLSGQLVVPHLQSPLLAPLRQMRRDRPLQRVLGLRQRPSYRIDHVATIYQQRARYLDELAEYS